QHVAARRAGTEAVPRPALGVHDERRRALIVEGAPRLPRASGLLEVGDVAPDRLDDVEPCLDVVNRAHGLLTQTPGRAKRYGLLRNSVAGEHRIRQISRRSRVSPHWIRTLCGTTVSALDALRHRLLTARNGLDGRIDALEERAVRLAGRDRFEQAQRLIPRARQV